MPALIGSTKKIPIAGTNKAKKISLEIIRQSFIVHLTSSSQIPSFIKDRTNECLAEERKLQPFVIVVGANLFALKEFYIFFYDTSFKCKSFLQAIDVCFKLFFVLNIRFPVECELLWLFIQQFIYEIKLKTDLSNAKLLTVCSDLKK